MPWTAVEIVTAGGNRRRRAGIESRRVSARTAERRWPIATARARSPPRSSPTAASSSAACWSIARRRPNATLVERFRPTADSIRWEIELTSAGPPWSTAISTQLHYPATPQSRFWTAWSDPEHRSDGWRDPLVLMPFADRSWSYQGKWTKRRQHGDSPGHGGRARRRRRTEPGPLAGRHAVGPATHDSGRRPRSSLRGRGTGWARASRSALRWTSCRTRPIGGAGCGGWSAAIRSPSIRPTRRPIGWPAAAPIRPTSAPSTWRSSAAWPSASTGSAARISPTWACSCRRWTMRTPAGSANRKRR